ncbi:MAG: hypothetical protein JKY65_27215 [Planctomycetes bacterium]|nr:hypothetical protein [Planctomycetota bacterium]
MDDTETAETAETAEDTPPPGGLPIGSILAGALLVLGGALGFSSIILWKLSFPDVQRFFMEVGLPLPAISNLALEARLPVVCLLLGLVSAGVVVGLGIAGKHLASRLVAAVSLCLLALLVAALTIGIAIPLSAVAKVAPLPARDPIPGRTAEIALEVEVALREAFARGVGTFKGPDGELRAYVIYTGPGVDQSAPATLPPYAKARAHSGCLVLPWGPAGNTASEREPRLLFPTGVAGGLDPEALDLAPGQPTPDWLDAAGDPRPVSIEGVPVLRAPAVLAAGGSGEAYSYSISLMRSRLDTNKDSFRPLRNSDSAFRTRIGQDDEFCDELYQLVVSVFRGFDPAPAADPLGREFVPESNLPIATFMTQVRR